MLSIGRVWNPSSVCFAKAVIHVLDIPAAGKTEKVGPAFAHHYHSVNTQDTQPEPNSVSQRAGVPLRAFPALPIHNASVMSNDYVPVTSRRYVS